MGVLGVDGGVSDVVVLPEGAGGAAAGDGFVVGWYWREVCELVVVSVGGRHNGGCGWVGGCWEVLSSKCLEIGAECRGHSHSGGKPGKVGDLK